MKEQTDYQLIFTPKYSPYGSVTLCETNLQAVCG